MVQPASKIINSASEMYRLTGMPKADNFIPHFHVTKAGIACKYYDLPCQIRKRSPYLKASPIILGALDNLSFYEVPTEEGRRYYLDSYLLIPRPRGKMVFVSDDHSHAGFAWALAQVCGIIKGNALLIHIDDHSDMARSKEFSRSARPLLADAAQFVRERVDLNQFIDFGTKCCGPDGPLLDAAELHFVDPMLIGRGISRPAPQMLGNIPFKDLSLELALKLIEQAKRVGRSVICDIDLDFFCGCYSNHLRNAWRGDLVGVPFEGAVREVAKIARRADFVTIATSPDYFEVTEQRNETRHLLEMIVGRIK